MLPTKFKFIWLSDFRGEDSGFDIPWVEVQNTMGRGFNIPWVGGQNTMGEGKNTMDRGLKYHG